MSEKQDMEVEPNLDAAPTEADQLKPNDDQLKPDPKWRIVNQVGRTVRPVAGPGSPERMRSEFERMRGVGIPGSIQLLDEKHKIVEQHGSFAEDKVRRYKDEDGKPYEPSVVATGAKPIDLSSIAEAIKSMPETDPDAPDAEPNPKIEFEKKVYPKVEWKAVAEETFTPKPKKPYTPPRVERMKNAPCRSGLTGIMSFFTIAGTKLDEMNHTEDRIRRRRRRFKLELLVRVLFGAPVCSTTVEAAYVDAVDATKM